MFRERKFLLLFLISVIFTFMASGGLFSPSATEAQYWQLTPPYNVLWPLWSPALSPLVGPVDPVTGLNTPVPLLTTLTRDTILPVQPCLAWDPCQPLPWALYNTPPTFGSGLLFFDQAYGLNTWPPPYLQDPITGAPAPITYLGTWGGIDAFDPGHIEYYIGLANITYALNFGISGQPFLDLLSAAQIFGLPPILPY
jgi:hypothetical protein